MSAPKEEALRFEHAQPSDFEGLLALRIEAMRESLERIGRFDAARARQRFASGFSPERTEQIFLRDDRIGFVAVKPDGDGLLLDHLYIRPPFQGRGFGAQVLARVFAQADDAGLALRVGALMRSDSNRFYQRHGFVQFDRGEWDVYYRRPPQVQA